MLQISIGLGQPGPSDPKSWSLFKQTKQKTAEALTEVHKIIQNNSVKMSVPLVNLKGQVVQVLDKTKHRNSTNSTSSFHSSPLIIGFLFSEAESSFFFLV